MSASSVQKTYTSLPVFLKDHMVKKGDALYAEWNVTGITKHVDMGCYRILDEEYDTFLELYDKHVFGARPKTSSLLEKHRDTTGPLLVDLDFRYEGGGRLMRRFNNSHVKTFVSHYVAAMIRFSKVEDLPENLEFFVTTKPAPETDKDKHKDGIHIQCPTLSTNPKYQYAIRGYLLQQNSILDIFGPTGIVNPPEDIYDVCVIHTNNWFLYGAGKPNKAQYAIDAVWRIDIEDIQELLSSATTDSFETLASSVEELLVESAGPTETIDILKLLSIRHNHTKINAPSIRTSRSTEWEELMINWGAGKAKLDTSRPVPKNQVEFEVNEGETVLAGVTATDKDDDLIVSTAEDNTRVTSATTEEDIKLAYRLARECILPEKRCGEYHDWVNMAICLKNIDDTDESFKVWCDITRRVNASHKKAHMSDAELRLKWNLIRVDGSKKLGMGSLQHWAKEDNPEKHRSILSETYTSWIINFANNTHVSIAEFVCRLYRHEFRCCKGAGRGQFEWYQFAPMTHSWKHMRTNTELRSRLSGRVKDEYIEAWRKLGKDLEKLKSDGESESSEKYKGVEERRKTLRGIERNLEMAAFKDSVMRECQEKFEDDEFIKKLNSDPYLVGVANGVLELQHWDNETRSGTPHVHFRDGRPEDYVSFQMGGADSELGTIPYVPYDPESPEQKALVEFFAKIYPDKALREYILTLLASCLEGTNKEQKFHVNQGVGSNGKSMVEMLMELTFGDYGTSISTATFTRKRPDSGAANPDIITVQKRRYIHCGEPDDDEKINTSIMKQWSGGDRIAARGLFADQEKFSIMGKIFVSTNDLPPISKTDNGTWRRMRVNPHTSIFKDPGDPEIDPSKHIYEKDLHLESKLKHWRTAFLSLLVHYYNEKYLKYGLREPECVMAASNKYKEMSDQFTKFFNAFFVRDPTAGPVRRKEIADAFTNYKRQLGRECELKQSVMFDRMKEICGNGNDREYWGIRLLSDEDDGESYHSGSTKRSGGAVGGAGLQLVVDN